MRQVQPEEQKPPELPPEEPRFSRGGGGGLALLPVLAWWLLVLGWVATTDRVGRDESRLVDFTDRWLPLLTFPFFLAALGAWWIPWSLPALIVMAAGWLGPLLAYLKKRDAAVPADARMLSAVSLLEPVIAAGSKQLRKIGIKIDLTRKAAVESLPDIAIAAGAATVEEAEATLAAARELPGFAGLREILQRGLGARAVEVLVDFDQSGGKVRHLVDGVWQPERRQTAVKEGRKKVLRWQESGTIPAENAKAILAALKALCGLSRKSGKSREPGQMVVSLAKRRIPCTVTLESGSDRKRVKIVMQSPPHAFPSLATLGMGEEEVGKLSEALGLANGLVVVSARPREGLTSTFVQVVMAADRLLRDFVIIEDAAARLNEVQNVKPVCWGTAEAATPREALQRALRDYPTAIVVPDLRDGPLAVEVVGKAAEMLVIVGVQAADASDAIENLLGLGVSRDLLAKVLIASVSQRLVRKLCAGCAEPFKPSADLRARIKRFRDDEPVCKRPAAEGCAECQGIGYVGRTGLFEIAGGPTVSRAILAKVDTKTLQKSAEKDGMTRLRDAGLRLVATGTTSVEELQRVFKKE
jgi:type II secretory ATPase GspE/PulE/Tfp pilus assembly ATPase PilB-like protein